MTHTTALAPAVSQERGAAERDPGEHHTIGARSAHGFGHDMPDLAHVLRTPMTSLKGAIDLLVAGILGPVPEPLMPLIAIAQRSTDRLAQLIDDLLLIQALEANEPVFRMTAMDLNAFIRGIVMAQGNTSDSRTGRITLTDHAPGALVRGDAQWLARALARILGHAVAVSTPDARPAVSLRRCREGFRLTCQIPEALAAETRAAPPPAHDRDLGLQIARLILDRHGGQMTLDPVAQPCATIHMTLPEADAPPFGAIAWTVRPRGGTTGGPVPAPRFQP